MGHAAQLHVINYEPDQWQAPHSHPVTSVTLVYSGSLVERAGSQEAWAGPLSLVVKPAGTEHADRFGPQGARTLQLVLRDHMLQELLGDSAGLGSWRWLSGGEAIPPFLELLRGLLQGASRDDLQDDVAEVLAVLSGSDGAPFRGGRAPAWLCQVRQRIEDAFAQRLRVRDLARDVGVHPVFLARQFRRFYGTSATQRLKQLRVQAAARLLSENAPLVEVALDSGFSDQSHLCREFKALTGLTPGRYRRLIGASPVRQEGTRAGLRFRDPDS